MKLTALPVFGYARPLVMLGLSLSLILPAQATWMDDYYNSAGASANVTGPSAYQTQSRGVISGGGLSYRVPQTNNQMFGFTPPGFKAGCGGIDLWGGSFSYINKANFVALLRNIGQNATGYFFKIALKTMAPEIEAALTDLNNMLQKVNQNGIDSCKAGEALATSAVSALGLQRQTAADTFGANVIGSATDFFGAVSGNSTDPHAVQQSLDQSKAAHPELFNDAAGNPIIPTGPFNILYNALSASRAGGGIFGSISATNGMTPEQIDLLISLLGTTIIIPSTADTAAGGVINIKPTINWDTFIGNRAPGGAQDTAACGGAQGGTGTSFCMHICAAATGPAPQGEKCIFSGDGDALALTTVTGFSQMARDSLKLIKAAIQTRQPLTDPNALAIINMSSVPIYSMIAATTSVDGPASSFLTDQVIDVYADSIGTEMAYRFIQSAMVDADRLAKAYAAKVGLDQERVLKPVMDTAAKVLAQATASYAEVQRTSAARASSVTETIRFSQSLQKSLSANMQASLRFKPN
jgi:conjugative transfer pilus assembly protein TraH